MSFLSTVVGLLKKLAIVVLIVAIAVPLRYGSTDRRHLTLRLFHSALTMKHYLVSDEARPTLSAEYRAFEEILRNKPPSQQNPIDDPVIYIKNLRTSFRLDTMVPKPSQCQVNKEIFEHDGHSVDTYWVENHQKKFQTETDKLLLYIHGGAYIIGDIYSYSGIECYLSELFNVSILHIEYRLSPEHSLPAAVEDTVALYRALLRHNVSPSQILIMGDSAGGGLSLLTVQALITHQLPVPRGVIVLSPWTDLSASGASYQRNRHLDVMLGGDNDWILPQVLGPNHAQLSANSSMFSPMFGSFEGFPSLYINVGTAEILEDDSKSVFKNAKEVGVDVTLEEGLHLMHAYPLFFPYYPEGRNTLNNIKQWIQTQFEQN